jgi:hypothetical protein
MRHSVNTNLVLHRDGLYLGLPVMVARGPLIREYLEILHRVLHCAWSEYPRTWAVRVDLRFPKHGDYLNADACITRFINSLKRKVEHDRSRAAANNPYFHDSRVRYVWAREFGEEGKPHYHVLLLFNRDAYFSLGRFDSPQENMYQRITAAWASALDIGYDGAKGLPEFADSQETDGTLWTELASVFYRASYLCKAQTKEYQIAGRNFGASQS